MTWYNICYNTVSKLCKAFKNGSTATKKISKMQLHKIGHLGGFSGRLLGPLAVAASATHATMYKNVWIL